MLIFSFDENCYDPFSVILQLFLEIFNVFHVVELNFIFIIYLMSFIILAKKRCIGQVSGKTKNRGKTKAATSDKGVTDILLAGF